MGLQGAVNWGAEAGAGIIPPYTPPHTGNLGGESRHPAAPPPQTRAAGSAEGETGSPPSLPASCRRAMRAAWLLLLALGLPACPWGCRCLGGGPPVLPPTSSCNETLGGGRRPRAPDVVVLAAMGGWLGAILIYVGRYVRRSRAETQLHLEYLRALPCEPPSPKEEEGKEETLSTVLLGAVDTSHHQQQTREPQEHEGPPQTCPSGWSGFVSHCFHPVSLCHPHPGSAPHVAPLRGWLLLSLSLWGVFPALCWGLALGRILGVLGVFVEPRVWG